MCRQYAEPTSKSKVEKYIARPTAIKRGAQMCAAFVTAYLRKPLTQQ